MKNWKTFGGKNQRKVVRDRQSSKFMMTKIEIVTKIGLGAPELVW